MIPDSLERAIFGAYATHAVHLAVKHGVFTHLVEHGASEAAGIASGTGLDEETLDRLLIVLGSFGVLRLRDDRHYEIPSTAMPYLDECDSRYIGGFVSHLATSASSRFPALEDYLSRGKLRVDAAARLPFDSLYADDQLVHDFLAAMWQLSFDVSHELAQLAGLDTVRHVVDVGGASGPFSVAALQAFPTMRATVFDLSCVEPHLARTRAKYCLGDRLSFVPGDFFRDELPKGDCVAFGYILSDWTDETCVELLRKAYRACAPAGRVLIMERLFDKDRRGPLATAVMNVSMHVETSGRHRTSDEYTRLLTLVGFTDCTTRRSTQDKHLVIGHKSTRG